MMSGTNFLLGQRSNVFLCAQVHELFARALMKGLFDVMPASTSMSL